MSDAVDPSPTQPTDPAADRAAVVELVAAAMEALQQGGDAALQEFLAGTGRHRSRVESRLRSLRELGLLDGAPVTAMPERLGDFRLLERLGTGGMGVVYRARQVSVDREVALKVVRPEHLQMAGVRERFQREIASIARLQHEGIVRLYSFGEDQGIPWFAMELVAGADLAELMAALRSRPPRELRGRDLFAALGGPADAPLPDLFAGDWQETCLRIAERAAAALAAAHHQGVLHRDLKPSNVMVTAQGRVVLLDFGLARHDGGERLTRTGAQLGTVHYMAPEQVRGEADRIDERTDVYALGVILRELLTLRPAFAGETVPAVMDRVLAGLPAPIDRQAAEVGFDAETICATAMELDPGRRYASAAALHRDLELLRQRRPITARRAGYGLRLLRLAQRHKAWTSAVAVAFLGLLLAPAVIAVREYGLRVELEQEVARANTNVDVAAQMMTSLVRRLRDESVDDIIDLQGFCKDVALEAGRFLDTLLVSNPTEAAARLKLATTLLQAGELHRSLRDFDRSEAAYRRVLDLLPADVPADLRAERIVCELEARYTLGSIAVQRGRGDEAGWPLLIEALDWLRQQGPLAGLPLPARRTAGLLLHRVAQRRSHTDTPAARALFEEALALRQSIASDAGDAESWLKVAETLGGLLWLYSRQRPPPELEEWQRQRAAAVRNASLVPIGVDQVRIEVANHLGMGDPEPGYEARVAQLRAAIALLEPLVAAWPSRTRPRAALRSMRATLAAVRWQHGERDVALAEYRELIADAGHAVAVWPGNAYLVGEAARLRFDLARWLMQAPDGDAAARGELMAGIGVLRRLGPTTTPLAITLQRQQDMWLALAGIELRAGDLPAAEVAVREARALLPRILDLAKQQRVSLGDDLAVVLMEAELLLRRERPDAAAAALEALGRRLPKDVATRVPSLRERAAGHGRLLAILQRAEQPR